MHEFRNFSNSTTAPGLAWLGSLIFAVVITLVAIEFLSFAAWNIYQRMHFAFENQAASPVYDDAPWVREFWKEEGQRLRGRRKYVPFRLWGATEWHSTYVNTDQTELGMWRRTTTPDATTCESRPRVKLWVFGGSTVYGTFEPDWATLPSYLSRQLNADLPDCVLVHNFGVDGYVTNQEVILLLEQLKAGHHPDIVIFYDGFNDAGAALEAPGPPSPHHSFASIRDRIQGTRSLSREFLANTYTARLMGLITTHPSLTHWSEMTRESPRKATEVLDNYEANLRVVSVLSEAYHFRLYSFWQPTLPYGNKPLVSFEQQLAAHDAQWYPLIAAIYQEAERRAMADRTYTFLARVFDSVTQPIYIDEAHLGPLGNELVAKAIARQIENALPPADSVPIVPKRSRAMSESKQQ